jgi:hypothetical protein
MDELAYFLSVAVSQQQAAQFRLARQREEDRSRKQQRFARVVSYDASTGEVLVSENGGGVVAAKSLSASALSAGLICSYFIEDGSAVGWVDTV